MNRTGVLGVIVAAAALLGLGPAVSAQVLSEWGGVLGAVRPPRIDSPGQAPVWLYYAVGVVALGLCIGIAVAPGRREYDD